MSSEELEILYSVSDNIVWYSKIPISIINGKFGVSLLGVLSDMETQLLRPNVIQIIDTEVNSPCRNLPNFDTIITLYRGYKF